MCGGTVMVVGWYRPPGTVARWYGSSRKPISINFSHKLRQILNQRLLHPINMILVGGTISEVVLYSSCLTTIFVSNKKNLSFSHLLFIQFPVIKRNTPCLRPIYLGVSSCQIALVLPVDLRGTVRSRNALQGGATRAEPDCDPGWSPPHCYRPSTVLSEPILRRSCKFQVCQSIS